MRNSDEKKAVKVLFPCIHGLANGQLVTINCFPSEELKGTIKVVTGVDEEIARRIIGASRFNESDSRAGIGVMALFSNPLFSGESYGLALAVADKLARFDACGKLTEIYATGTIPADGCGRVEAIDGFAEKLELLLEQAKPSSLFIYPKNNLPTSLDHIQEKLHLLQNKGVDCVAIAAMDDLQGKLWVSDITRNKKLEIKNLFKKGENIPLAVRKTVFGITLLVLACFFIYLALQAPIGDPTQKLANQNTQEKKNNSSEAKKIFSHQEIKQEGRIIDTNPQPSSKLTHERKRVEKGAEDQHQVLILESTDTDSSLY